MYVITLGFYISNTADEPKELLCSASPCVCATETGRELREFMCQKGS